MKLPNYGFRQFKLYIKWLLFKIAKNWVVLNRIHPKLRPWIWSITGVKTGKNVSIGYDVYYDITNAKLITIEDNVWITSRCLILCHQRDLSNYKVNDDVNKLPYLKKPVIVKKGAHIGMGSIILPGVTVGEGSIIGAGAIVTRDVPAWSIAAGNPAKVIKKISSRD